MLAEKGKDASQTFLYVGRKRKALSHAGYLYAGRKENKTDRKTA